MKSEHRHELQTNELGKFAEKMAVFIDVHGNRLMIGVCLACLPLAGIIYWWRSSSNAQAAGWRDFSAAINSSKAEDFHAVWQDHPGSTPAFWARVHEGEQWLSDGVNKMFSNVDLGKTDLMKARDAFQAVIDDQRRAPAELRDRALIGLGRALESMSDGSEGEAVKAYETLVKEFPNSIYKKDAEERIAVLNRGSGQEFYAWFSKYPRPKAAVKAPRDKMDGDILDDEAKEQLDKINSMLQGTGKKSTGDDESLELPESKTPEEKPAADKKPATEPPDDADEKPASKPDSEPKPDAVPEPESKSEKANPDKQE